MRIPALTLVALAAALVSGCGKKTEDAMNKKFDENFRASCIGASTKAGAPAAIATQVCDCTIADINKKYSATDKLTLSQDKAEPIMAECVNKAVKK